MRDSMMSLNTEECTCQVCGAEYDNHPDTIRCCTEVDE
jgi:hypothetical protein